MIEWISDKRSPSTHYQRRRITGREALGLGALAITGILSMYAERWADWLQALFSVGQ